MPHPSPWARLGLIVRCGSAANDAGHRLAHYYDQDEIYDVAVTEMVPLCERSKPTSVVHPESTLAFLVTPYTPCPECKITLVEENAKLDATKGKQP
jgi:hypothetical protein